MTRTTILTRSATRSRFAWWQIAAHIGALIPLAVLIWDTLHDQLTANPIQALEDRTGVTALVILVLSLACTPVMSLLGIKQVVKLRRPLGLYGFMYAALHVSIFLVLDYGLDLQLILGDLAQKPYILVGSLAILLLIPLAITSTKGWMKRLGKRWRQLHMLVYLIVPLVVAHYYWVVKADVRVPLQYATVVGLLLVVRIPNVRRFFVNLRYRLTAQKRR
jgi:sulfoxide reductase heme-binding subunit YedZ